MTTAVDNEDDNQLWQGRGYVELHPELGPVQLVGNPPEMTISRPATTTTDDDLHDLLFASGMTVYEIEEVMRHPEARQLAKLTLDAVHRVVINRMAQHIIEELFPGELNVN